MDTTIGPATSNTPSSDALGVASDAAVAANETLSASVGVPPDQAPHESVSAPAAPPPAYVPPAPRPDEPTPSQATQDEVGATGLDVGPIDCGRPSTSVSLTICTNADLRGRDGHISAIYRTLVGKADPDQRAQFAQEQRAWIISRNACGAVTCLVSSYDQRLRTITSEAWAQYNSQRATGSAQ